MENNQTNLTNPTESVVKEVPFDIDALPDKKIKQAKPKLGGRVVILGKPELTTTGMEYLSKNMTSKKEKLNLKIPYEIVGTGEKSFETYSGITRFIDDLGNPSDPSIYLKGHNQAANLFKVWLAKKGFKEEDVSIKDFLKGLEGMTAKLKEVATAYEGQVYYKNIVESFV